ncbi:hypothetical protein D3C77_330230 [compost metagenome]
MIYDEGRMGGLASALKENGNERGRSDVFFTGKFWSALVWDVQADPATAGQG